MQINLRSKKMKAIVGGGFAVFLIVALGLGLGFGLQSDDEVSKYTIFGNEYTEAELVNDGVTNNGVTYEFKKKDDGLYVVLPSATTFSTTPAMLQDTNFGRTISVGGEDAQDLEGLNHFFNINYAGIDLVKIPNDGYIWGGFYLNDNNEPTLRSGLTEPVEFGTINENGDALINLARVYELQANIQTDKSVSSAYVLNKESDRVGTWRIFAYDDGSEVTMRVATKTYPRLVAEIWHNPPLLSSDKITEWPSTDGKAYWGQDENSKPQAFNNENHPAIDFNVGDLVDANGDPLTVTWLVGGLPNTSYDIPLTNMFYKVRITGGKAEIPVVDKKVQISPNGKFEVSGQTFQIPKKSDVYTLTSDLEVKVN